MRYPDPTRDRTGAFLDSVEDVGTVTYPRWPRRRLDRWGDALVACPVCGDDVPMSPECDGALMRHLGGGVHSFTSP